MLLILQEINPNLRKLWYFLMELNFCYETLFPKLSPHSDFKNTNFASLSTYIQRISSPNSKLLKARLRTTLSVYSRISPRRIIFDNLSNFAVFFSVFCSKKGQNVSMGRMISSRINTESLLPSDKLFESPARQRFFVSQQ